MLQKIQEEFSKHRDDFNKQKQWNANFDFRLGKLHKN
jgi:hypothetical protein